MLEQLYYLYAIHDVKERLETQIFENLKAFVCFV